MTVWVRTSFASARRRQINTPPQLPPSPAAALQKTSASNPMWSHPVKIETIPVACSVFCHRFIVFLSFTRPLPPTITTTISELPTPLHSTPPPRSTVPPGNPVSSAKASGDLLDRDLRVTAMWGTSMACPAVAGVAAIVRQFLARASTRSSSPTASPPRPTTRPTLSGAPQGHPRGVDHFPDLRLRRELRLREPRGVLRAWRGSGYDLSTPGIDFSASESSSS